MTVAPPAAFDTYAAGYDGGMDNPVKARLGGGADDFIAVKVRWLRRHWPDLWTGDSLSILDYGCGTAALPRLLRAAGVRGPIVGTDVSAGMLREARRTWPEHLPVPSFRTQDGAATGLPDASCDAAVIAAVLHHVPVADRAAVYAELHRVLRPGGRLAVFEHNPWNPVTRYVVARTPIDRDAVLLSRTEVTRALTSAGWRDVRTSDLMFLPPRLGALADAADRSFGWLPLGGQYVVTARK